MTHEGEWNGEVSNSIHKSTDQSPPTIGHLPPAFYDYILHCKSLPHQFTYSLTPWSRFLLEKLTGYQLVKNFLAFYGT